MASWMEGQNKPKTDAELLETADGLATKAGYVKKSVVLDAAQQQAVSISKLHDVVALLTHELKNMHSTVTACKTEDNKSLSEAALNHCTKTLDAIGEFGTDAASIMAVHDDAAAFNPKHDYTLDVNTNIPPVKVQQGWNKDGTPIWALKHANGTISPFIEKNGTATTMKVLHEKLGTASKYLKQLSSHHYGIKPLVVQQAYQFIEDIDHVLHKVTELHPEQFYVTGGHTKTGSWPQKWTTDADMAHTKNNTAKMANLAVMYGAPPDLTQSEKAMIGAELDKQTPKPMTNPDHTIADMKTAMMLDGTKLTFDEEPKGKLKTAWWNSAANDWSNDAYKFKAFNPGDTIHVVGNWAATGHEPSEYKGWIHTETDKKGMHTYVKAHTYIVSVPDKKVATVQGKKHDGWVIEIFDKECKDELNDGHDFVCIKNMLIPYTASSALTKTQLHEVLANAGHSAPEPYTIVHGYLTGHTVKKGSSHGEVPNDTFSPGDALHVHDDNVSKLPGYWTKITGTKDVWKCIDSTPKPLPKTDVMPLNQPKGYKGTWFIKGIWSSTYPECTPFKVGECMWKYPGGHSGKDMEGWVFLGLMKKQEVWKKKYESNVHSSALTHAWSILSGKIVKNTYGHAHPAWKFGDKIELTLAQEMHYAPSIMEGWHCVKSYDGDTPGVFEYVGTATPKTMYTSSKEKKPLVFGVNTKGLWENTKAQKIVQETEVEETEEEKMDAEHEGFNGDFMEMVEDTDSVVQLVANELPLDVQMLGMDDEESLSESAPVMEVSNKEFFDFGSAADKAFNVGAVIEPADYASPTPKQPKKKQTSINNTHYWSDGAWVKKVMDNNTPLTAKKSGVGPAPTEMTLGDILGKALAESAKKIPHIPHIPKMPKMSAMGAIQTLFENKIAEIAPMLETVTYKKTKLPKSAVVKNCPKTKKKSIKTKTKKQAENYNPTGQFILAKSA
jgi:hypothetical protein